MTDQLGDRVTPEERFAEPAGADVDEPVNVLDRQRIAEPEIGHDPHAIGRLHLRVALDAENGDERIPRQDP